MSTSLVEGSIFGARYRVVRCIAAGGMGAIYEVVHLETERRRALKVMHPHIVSSPELRERFKSEARVAAKIDSDYIVDVFDAGVDDVTQMPFLVMELLKGEELGKRLERLGKFSAFDAVNFLWQTALALDKTHKANIVHRDLKPENLFLNERDDGPPRVKVLDFGVAKFVADVGTQANVTRSVGTPLYMAPEQFLGQKVSAGCDIYALAMMAYTMMVGEAYWTPEAQTNETVFAFARHVQNGPIQPPSTRAARRGVALTADFDRWFQKATSVNASDRYPSATATIAALGEVVGVNPTRLVGAAASDPFVPQRPSAPDLMGPGMRIVGQSGPGLISSQQGISAAGVVAPVQPKSRAGTMVALGLGAAIVLGVGVIAVSRSISHSDAAPSAAPAAEAASAAASAAPTAAAAPATASPSSAPAPTAAPAPTSEPSAAETAPPASPPTSAPVAAAPRPAGKAPAAPASPAHKPSAAPAAQPAAAPAAKQPAYSRD